MKAQRKAPRAGAISLKLRKGTYFPESPSSSDSVIDENDRVNTVVHFASRAKVVNTVVHLCVKRQSSWLLRGTHLSFARKTRDDALLLRVTRRALLLRATLNTVGHRSFIT